MCDESEPLLLSNTTQPGKFEVYFDDAKKVLVFPEEEEGERREARIGEHVSEWAKNEMPEKQLFTILKEDDHYYIIWKDQYALTYDGNSVFWRDMDRSSKQWWKIESAF